MYDLTLIKQRINCVGYAQRVGLPIGKSGDRCISPLREGAKNPTSFVVYDDFYFDFAEGSGGDVIELCAAINHDGDRGSAIRELAKLTGVVSDNVGNTEQWLAYTKRMNAMTAYYNTQLTESDRQYLHSRGVDDDSIARLRIGRVTDGPLKGRLFLPYFSGADGYVCYYATRAMPGGTFQDNKYMKQKKDDHCQHLPWGLQTLNRSGNTLVIAEGYFDCISFEIQGYPVLSAITGRFSREQIPIVLSVAKKFSKVFIVYDNDERTRAGESFARSMSEILIRHRIPFVVGTVPSMYKDISEYYSAGGDLQRIIDAAEDGITYIASHFIEFSDLEAFMYTVARHTKRTTLDEIFNRLKSSARWNEKSLISLQKSCTTAPPETIVVNEILSDHQLVYVPSVGFYEYRSGVWTRLSDESVQSYVDKTLGEFSTYQRVKAITGLLKTRALRSDLVFDRQPVWNFINGTLELETGTFRDHNPSDYCSVQSRYPYNPDATYHSWSKFIDDITAGDPRAAELLQFIPGYALFHDCPHEKIFVLTGSGGNGKSRYLKILQDLFGAENCSHVTPRGLLDKFQRILLKDSIINLAGEIKSDLTDVEEYMKQIASGETQSACYKSKDYVTFDPRSKLVYACNGQLQSGDTSDGLARRLIIVDFKVSFVDRPDPNDPYQRKKDIHILDSLTQELNSGGIFNWAYEGYKLLKTVGYFTETNDQTELLTEFKRSSNPVMLFWEENAVTLPESISNYDLYHKYLQWCVDNGERPSKSSVFHREFKKLCGKAYTAYRTASERGYKRL